MDTTFTREGLKKLVVAQLKQICKENRISGYSKLSKDPLIEKLISWQHGRSASKDKNCSSSAAGPAPTIVQLSVSQPCKLVDAAKHPAPSVEERPSLISPGGLQASISAKFNSEINDTGTPNRFLKRINRSDDLESSRPDEREPNSKKMRLAATDSLVSTRLTNATSEILTKRVYQKNSHISVSQVKASDLVKKASAVARSAYSESQITQPKAFQPLVASASNRVFQKIIHTLPKSVQPSVTPTSLPRLESYGSFSDWQKDSVAFTQPLGNISLPPSLSQRKLMPNMAVILSGISFEHLGICALVSKGFRYAAYLSAKQHLYRNFSGKTLDEFLAQHTSTTINFWPYLIYRTHEAARRQQIYASSFVAKGLKGKCCVLNRIWANPDHPKQSAIAARFLLTRFFFLVSVGAPTKDEPDLETVVGVQEVIPDELWKISIHSASSGSCRDFYALESTCEVVGRLPSSDGQQSGFDLRSDWSSYISTRLQGCTRNSNKKSSLIDYLHWSNHEEYDKGISKLWLSRMRLGGSQNIAMLDVANRYVLACVVANSISGEWMSYTSMQQDFNGISSSVFAGPLPKVKKLNLYLPDHHHVESIHFETSKKIPLHPSIAVVQTPAREYYILRDNGMQIGVEEDGVAKMWMVILGCKVNGLPLD